MEAVNHARFNSVAVEGFEDVFSSQVAPPIEAQSQAQQSSARALATARAIARCLDVRSEAVIERHKVTKPKNNKKKKKTVEEWRIKWTSGKGSPEQPSELSAVDPHEQGLFQHVGELLRQNSELIAKLEAATYRIGYLESELENLRNQAGYSDCDAQVNELPAPKPAIRAIRQVKPQIDETTSTRSSSSQLASTSDSSTSSPVNDFWSDEQPVLTQSAVGRQSEVLSQNEPSIFSQLVEPDLPSPNGLFNWLPPRA